MGLIATGLGTDAIPPLDPNAQQARELLLRELSKPEYQASKSTGIQQLGKAILDWLATLHLGGGPGLPGLGPLIITLLIVAAIVVAFVIFGLPRLNRRSHVNGALFGDDDARDADALRDAAQRAAASGDFSTAIAEQFRAIARGLGEHEIVTTFPGTTASGFARQAGRAFPELERGLATAAGAFDDVRYLGRAGTREQWLQIAELDASIRAASPRLETASA